MLGLGDKMIYQITAFILRQYYSWPYCGNVLSVVKHHHNWIF